ncbi:hypothetical protein [Robiginitalea sp. IMCC43444]
MKRSFDGGRKLNTLIRDSEAVVFYLQERDALDHAFSVIQSNSK